MRTAKTVMKDCIVVVVGEEPELLGWGRRVYIDIMATGIGFIVRVLGFGVGGIERLIRCADVLGYR